MVEKSRFLLYDREEKNSQNSAVQNCEFQEKYHRRAVGEYKTSSAS
jgi:hypothetical protein